MYIKDLKSYSYLSPMPPALAVGWLDERKRFTTGECPKDVRDRLVDLARDPRNILRGIHDCQFCPRTDEFRQFQVESPTVPGEMAYLGSGEVWVTGADGTSYAAPTLIVHYIDAHHYLPPQEFIDAVRR